MTLAGVRSFAPFSRILATFFVLALAGVLSACEASDDPHLVAPEVDDLWVADLHQYSEFIFGDLAEDDEAWGLLRVVEVTDSSVTVITSTEANEIPRFATNLIRYPDEVVFDPTERIEIARDQLLSQKAAGLIRETRRP